MEYLGKLNKKLLWDYEVSEEDLKEKKVFIFYLSRVLNNGNSADISELPLGLIKKYMDKLCLSRKVTKFWECYFANIQ
jgi:hypothetical protein